VKTRIIIFYLLVVLGVATISTGAVLYFWPRGPQSGRIQVLSADKSTWQDIHTQASLLATVVLAVHLIENRRCVKVYVRETLTPRNRL